MSLNYVLVILPSGKNHCHGGVCQCEENCKCGCKGKIGINLINFVCLDSTGCGCKKVKNVSDFPIKEAKFETKKDLFPFNQQKFFTIVENLNISISQTEIFHPPD